jgi:hypothetical protein
MMSVLQLALVGQVLVWLIVLGVFVASRQASLFHPLTVYLGFHALVFIVRPIEVCFLGFDFGWQYMHFEPSEADLLRTICVTSVGLIVFATVTILVGRTRVEFPSSAVTPFTVDQRRGLIFATLLLGPLVLFSIYRTNTGHFMGEQHNGTYILTGDSGYVVEAQYMFGPLACAWLVVTRFKWWVWIPLTIYIGYRAYTGWMRWTIVLLVFAIAMTYLWQNRKRWFSLGVILALIPMLLLFHWLGRNRENFKHFLGFPVTETQEQAMEGVPAGERFKIKNDGPDYANFDFLTFVLNVVPHRTGTFSYGAQYLQLFTEPIPRKLWPGKPIGAPVRFFNLNNYGDFVGMTPTVLGDGWMSGGWAGLIITMTVVGTFLGGMHRLFWKHINNNIFCLFYMVGLAMLPQWYRDGGISISKFLFWNLSPLFIWIFCTWLAGGKFVPTSSVLLRPGSKVKLIAARDGARGQTC